MVNDQPFNNWKLRAAAASVRFRLQMAKAGAFAGLICVAMGHELQFSDIADVVPRWIPTVLYVASPVVSALFLIPALRVKCPKCSGRYCTFSGIFRKTQNLPPCTSCGFDVEGYIPRYG
jgi:hypothetical protein